MQPSQTPSRYLEILAQQYPTARAASAKIISLEALLSLPKGTEHFVSDLHGEYEAFLHILNNASGAIREKVRAIYGNLLPEREQAELATLIYYTEAKLQEIKERESNLSEWYQITFHRLLEICRLVAAKYPRSKVRAALPEDFASLLDEMLHLSYDMPIQEQYYQTAIRTIIDIDCADEFILAVCDTIKRLIVDRLHIVGDIFDRGPRADIILDQLMEHHAVDIQWGNHDVLWMGAAAGSRTCIANVLNNSITYSNLEVIETGYGINLRPLALFANRVYQHVDTACFMPKAEHDGKYDLKDAALVARMHKAIAVILFKLEGQIILRNPNFGMEDRLLLDKIDRTDHCINIGGQSYRLRDIDFPTVDPQNPYQLSREEAELMRQLRFSFEQSEKLQRHVRFLYAKGGLYLCCNQNLLFHGCIPMNEDGSFEIFSVEGTPLAGRAFLDACEALARQGYYAPPESPRRQLGKDFLWFLWCGRHSPLFGRDKMATFERLLIDAPQLWAEQKNPYYRYSQQEESCVSILREFGLFGEHAHIINGHVPVKSKDGEQPVKANGRLIVIDGGFCRAYQPQTGIAGYTLIASSTGTRLIAHEPFGGVAKAIRENKDILSASVVFEPNNARIRLADTDDGAAIRRQIGELRELLHAYRMGTIKQREE